MGVGTHLWDWLKPAIYLAKVPLCLLIGYSTLFGYFLAESTVSLQAVLTGTGIFFIAAGAATLNSVQDHYIDTIFSRTRNRPLPRGTVGRPYAVIQALLLFASGGIALFFASGSVLPLAVAVIAVLLYNAVYTPLKQKTVLAIVPGAICGALPPYIGWLAGGGGRAYFEAFLLVAVMLLWQIPHFWLIILQNKEDYKTGIIPSLFSHFQEKTIKRLFITWIGGLITVMLLFTVLPSMHMAVARVLIFLNSCSLLLLFIFGFKIDRPVNYRMFFSALNGTLFLHMTIVIAGTIWS